MAEPTKPSWLSKLLAAWSVVLSVVVAIGGVLEVDPPKPQPEPTPIPAPPEPAPQPQPAPTPEAARILSVSIVDANGDDIDPESTEGRKLYAAASLDHGGYTVTTRRARQKPTVVTVAIGKQLPPTPEPPKPVDPPAPIVVDNLAENVQAAFTADRGTYQERDALIRGYVDAVAICKGNEYTTIPTLYAAIVKAVRAQAGSVSLPKTRDVLRESADKHLPLTGELNEATRAKIIAQFERSKKALEACK